MASNCTDFTNQRLNDHISARHFVHSIAYDIKCFYIKGFVNLDNEKLRAITS